MTPPLIPRELENLKEPHPFAIVRHPRAFFYEAELYRLRGEALRETGAESFQEVDTCFGTLWKRLDDTRRSHSSCARL